MACLTAKASESPEVIKVGSYLTPGLINTDGSGLFNQLNNAVFSEMSRKNQLLLSSINRARTGINTGNLDAYFPELWENLPGDKSQYIVSDPIFYKRIILFTLQSDEPPQLSTLKNQLIGAVKGFSYGDKIKSNPHLNIIYQENDSVNIKLLLNKKIKAVLGGYPGTVMAINKNSRANEIHYDLNKPAAILESFYVCKNDVEGIKLCNAINTAIASLLAKGILELNEKTGMSRFNPRN